MTDLIPVRRRGRPKRQFAEAVAPTPETVAKLEPDHLSQLLRDGELSVDQERAGRQIHGLFIALRRGGSPASKLREPVDRATRRLPQSPLDRLSARQEEIWRQVYRPWMEDVGRRVVVRRPKLTALGVVERVVADNTSAGRLAALYQLPTESVLDALRDAMDAYNAYKKAKKRL